MQGGQISKLESLYVLIGQLQTLLIAIRFPKQCEQVVVVQTSHLILISVQGGHVSKVESLLVSGGHIQDIPDINLFVPRQ